MTADDIARQLVQGRISPEEFNKMIARLPGPATHRWLALYTQYENSDWSEAELRRRAEALLSA